MPANRWDRSSGTRKRRWAPNFALLAFSSVFTLVLLFGADRLLGRIAFAGLIFPPHSEVHYKTIEFTSDVTTNSLGFRDREFGDRKHRIRVVAVGDSFTFGWGVQQDEPWPKVLEQVLQQHGMDVEVADLGQPGAGPNEYTTIVERAISRLKPDFVVIGMLDGDDLQPCVRSKPNRSMRAEAAKAVWSAFPNIMRVLRDKPSWDKPRSVHSTISAGQMRSAWQAEARQELDKFSPEEHRRYDRLDPEVQRLYLSGDLNPRLIENSVRTPDYLVCPLHLERPGVRDAISWMGERLTAIKQAAAKNHAQVIVMGVPYAGYVGETDLQDRKLVGFDTEPAMLTSDAPDDAVRQACSRAGVPFIGILPEFRSRAKQSPQPLFYRYDGHFTAAGQRLFAETIAPKLEGLLRTAQNQK